jgi:hypothetical protein
MCFAIEISNNEPLALYTRWRNQSSTVDFAGGINWLGMWRFVAAGVLAAILLLAAILAVLQRRTKRQNRSMRDHLNRIAPTGE